MTQYEKIIKIMKTDPKRWWIANDFQHPIDGVFIGYEATARLSELKNKGLVETKKIGKYRACRLIVDAAPAEPEIPKEVVVVRAKAKFIGRDPSNRLVTGKQYEVVIKPPKVFQPIEMLQPLKRQYKNMDTFKKYWRTA